MDIVVTHSMLDMVPTVLLVLTQLGIVADVMQIFSYQVLLQYHAQIVEINVVLDFI